MEHNDFDSGWQPDAVSANAVWARHRTWNTTTNQFSSEIARLYRDPVVAKSLDFSRALTMLVAERDFLHDKLERIAHIPHALTFTTSQRDAAVEAVKILLGVIESDPEFSSVESTKHCTDAARKLMEIHALWHIETDHVQDELK